MVKFQTMTIEKNLTVWICLLENKHKCNPLLATVIVSGFFFIYGEVGKKKERGKGKKKGKKYEINS